MVVPPGPRRSSWRRCPSRGSGASASETRLALADYSVTTIGDLANLPRTCWCAASVRWAGRCPIARAASTRPRSAAVTRAKSVSHEHTFDIDTNDWEEIERTLLGLSEGVARLREGNVKAATVGVKVRDSHSRRLPGSARCPSRPTRPTTSFGWRLPSPDPEIRGIEVRLLGVVASNLTEREQLSLFPEASRPTTAGDGRDGPASATGMGPAPSCARDCWTRMSPEPFARDPPARSRGAPGRSPESARRVVETAGDTTSEPDPDK